MSTPTTPRQARQIGSVSYRKACECTNARASTGAIRTAQEPTADGKGVRYRVTFDTGPTCDTCGKAWKLDQ